MGSREKRGRSDRRVCGGRDRRGGGRDGSITIPQNYNSATFSSITILVFWFSTFLDPLTPGHSSRSRAFHRLPFYNENTPPLYSRTFTGKAMCRLKIVSKKSQFKQLPRVDLGYHLRSDSIAWTSTSIRGICWPHQRWHELPRFI